MPKKTLSLAALAVIAFAAHAEARDQIRIVGSSTVFPFAAAVAEEFGRSTKFRTPVVESTGSGGGLKLFCGGVGIEHPDLTNASRRIKMSEVETCHKNGVKDIVEVKFGFDGIVLASSKSAPTVTLSLREIFLALAKEVPVDGKMVPNPYTRWSEIDDLLPASKIEVLGPPPTSGTRDAFVELAMEGGCKTFAEIAVLKATDRDAYRAICHTLREDGAFIEAGENDNLIVQKLVANPGAFGIFGFSFLDQNRDKIQGSAADGVAPTFENISDGSYPVSRSLYFYVKAAHVGVVPGIKEYIEEFMSEEASGEFGYLTDKGLIPLPEGERMRVRKQALALAPLSM